MFKYVDSIRWFAPTRRRSVDKVNAQLGQLQVSDRSATLDYQLTLQWESQAGPLRSRVLTMRAEAERTGDAWTVVRHRVLGSR